MEHLQINETASINEDFQLSAALSHPLGRAPMRRGLLRA